MLVALSFIVAIVIFFLGFGAGIIASLVMDRAVAEDRRREAEEG